MQLHRSHVIHITFISVGLIFLAKLFFIQVLNDEYKLAAEKNIVQPVVEYPYRGAICDRHGAFLAYNVPIYDLMVIPKEVKHLDTSAFCQNFGISLPTFHKLLEKAKAYSYVKPSIFIKNISQETWAQVQDHVASYLGFFVQVRTVRQYPTPTLANTLGYIGEIDAQQLTSDSLSYYRKGGALSRGVLKEAPWIVHLCLGKIFKLPWILLCRYMASGSWKISWGVLWP
jgi:penicillin-binding protein 2